MLHAINKNASKICKMYKQIRVEINQNSLCSNSPGATLKIENDYDLHCLEEGPPKERTMTKDEALGYFKSMDVVRRLENVCAGLYRTKIIRGFCHLYAGQEAVATGIKSVMEPEDVLITAYRSHGFCYVMGCSAESIIAELAGRVTGVSRGKGGSMHMYADRMYGGNGIVGSHIPVGTGLGFAQKYAKKKGISLTVYGDGAANQGQSFESFNIAKLFNIPVLYVIENNLYGLGTKIDRAAANTKFYARIDYIPGVCCDGMDLIAVQNAIKWCADYVRSGSGPIFCECKTYRYFGHSMSDPGTSYRAREEIEEWREKNDCLKILKRKLIDSNLVTEADLKEIQKQNKKMVEEAATTASHAKFPDVKELAADTYIKPLEKFTRGVSIFHPYEPYLTNAFKRMPGPD